MVMGSWPLPFFSKSVKPDVKRKRAKKGSICTPQSASPNTLASYSNALMNRDSFGEKAREAFTVQYSGGPHLVFAENIRPEADYALPQTPFGAMKGAPSLCSPPPTPLYFEHLWICHCTRYPTRNSSNSSNSPLMFFSGLLAHSSHPDKMRE